MSEGACFPTCSHHHHVITYVKIFVSFFNLSTFKKKKEFLLPWRGWVQYDPFFSWSLIFLEIVHAEFVSWWWIPIQKQGYFWPLLIFTNSNDIYGVPSMCLASLETQWWIGYETCPVLLRSQWRLVYKSITVLSVWIRLYWKEPKASSCCREAIEGGLVTGNLRRGEGIWARSWRIRVGQWGTGHVGSKKHSVKDRV